MSYNITHKDPNKKPCGCNTQDIKPSKLDGMIAKYEQLFLKAVWGHLHQDCIHTYKSIKPIGETFVRSLFDSTQLFPITQGDIVNILNGETAEPEPDDAAEIPISWIDAMLNDDWQPAIEEDDSREITEELLEELVTI